MADRATQSRTLIDRYQEYRTARFLKHERTWSSALPGWRTQRRRRSVVFGLIATFALMFTISVLCAFGVKMAALLWFPACLLFFPLWMTLQIVSSRQGDAPQAVLDEFEIAQRNTARSIGLTITQNLMLVPIAYLIVGSLHFSSADLAYAGGLMALTVLLIGGCSPAMILGWIRPDPDPDPDPDPEDR